MSQDSIILNKSLKFAARIVKLYQYLCKEKHETVISKQIIRSGTSIGANANEAVYGVSKAEFRLSALIRCTANCCLQICFGNVEITL